MVLCPAAGATVKLTAIGVSNEAPLKAYQDQRPNLESYTRGTPAKDACTVNINAMNRARLSMNAQRNVLRPVDSPAYMLGANNAA